MSLRRAVRTSFAMLAVVLGLPAVTASAAFASLPRPDHDSPAPPPPVALTVTDWTERVQWAVTGAAVTLVVLAVWLLVVLAVRRHRVAKLRPRHP